LDIFCELGDDGGDGLVDAALEADRVGAGGDVLEALGEDGLGETVAVVVPSPASCRRSWLATSLTIWAPMFS
jgi:hypothetical protein